MAVSVSNIQHNERGLAFTFVGDGATTILPAVTYPRHVRPSTTVAVFVESAPTSWAHGKSSRTGLPTGAGTTVAGSTVAQNGTAFTVTCGSAVGNGVLASVEILFNQINN